MSPPMPPAALRGRVSISDDEETYELIGRRTRAGVLALLPDDFSFQGKRVLDFGCGAGRTLRQLLDLAGRCELMGCDIDRASIEWLQEHLDPPVRAFVNGHEPPLALEDGSVDLVLAISVFTHLGDSWSRWLAELHRVLAPGGLLLSTHGGPGVWHRTVGGRNGVEYDRIGMHVEQAWRGFESEFGPAVSLAPWWLREHWGRAFDLLALEDEGFAVMPGVHRGQGVTLWRRRDVPVEPEALTLPADDPRELEAALLNVELARLESIELATHMRHVEAELAAVRASRIMRWSEPLRRGWYRLRRRSS